MTQITWDRLGPREKQILAILRRADGPLTSRDVLGRLREDGADVAYTTVSTTLDRLVEKGVVCRTEETHAGSPRFLHTFEADDYRRLFVEGIVDDVAAVLGDAGLEVLVRQARTAAENDTSTERNTT